MAQRQTEYLVTVKKPCEVCGGEGHVPSKRPGISVTCPACNQGAVEETVPLMQALEQLGFTIHNGGVVRWDGPKK